MDSILSLVVILCSLLLHVCHYYTFILIFTLLCFRARGVSGHAAQRDSCHAQLRARHYRVTVTAAVPASRGFLSCMFALATRHRAPAPARDYSSRTARFPGLCTICLLDPASLPSSRAAYRSQ